jgi:tripartite-type tricarboxylate transporter receptor subunit TctC
MGKHIAALGAAALLAASVLSGAARAKTVADFYKGSTMKLISSSGNSSGYTVWARLIAEVLPRHLPGAPAIVVQSMVGAGGLLLTNYMYNVAPKDGSMIAAVPREAPGLSLIHGDGVKYDSLKFNWLGSPTGETNICVASSSSPFRSVQDLYKQPLIVGTTGAGTGMHIFPVALDALLGLKFKTIDGYKDTGLILMAIDRGEIQGSCQSAETLMRSRGDDIRSGKWRVLLQAGLKPNPDFPNVPFVLDLAKTDEQRQALRLLYSGQAIGRPYLAPPGVPADRVKALRKAFTDTFADPAFLAEVKKQGYEMDPVSGDEMMAVLQDLAKTPKPIMDRVSAFVRPPKKG